MECSVSIQDVLNCSVKGLPPVFFFFFIYIYIYIKFFPPKIYIYIYILLILYTIEERKRLLALFMANLSINRNDSCLRLQIDLKSSIRG